MQIRITDNFAANLQSIESCWTETDFPQGYDQLLETLQVQVIPNLEQYPEMGRCFSRHTPESVEASIRIQKLANHEQAIREYLLKDYLLLYLLSDAVYLLAIKHHQQLAYDFERLWLNR